MEPIDKDDKEYIDSLSYEALLRGMRFFPVGDPWFQGAREDYWIKRMAELRETVDHVAISKRIGF